MQLSKTNFSFDKYNLSCAIEAFGSSRRSQNKSPQDEWRQNLRKCSMKMFLAGCSWTKATRISSETRKSGSMQRRGIFIVLSADHGTCVGAIVATENQQNFSQSSDSPFSPEGKSHYSFYKSPVVSPRPVRCPVTRLVINNKWSARIIGARHTLSIDLIVAG